MATKAANAAQSKLMTDMTDLVNEIGLGFLYGDEYEGCTAMQRHHVVGRSYKQNKVPIGHEFVMPVPYGLHEPNEKHKYHVGHCKKAFVKKFGTQRSIYAKLIDAMVENGYPVPDQHILDAIQATSA